MKNLWKNIRKKEKMKDRRNVQLISSSLKRWKISLSKTYQKKHRLIFSKKMKDLILNDTYYENPEVQYKDLYSNRRSENAEVVNLKIIRSCLMMSSSLVWFIIGVRRSYNHGFYIRGSAVQENCAISAMEVKNCVNSIRVYWSRINELYQQRKLSFSRIHVYWLRIN